MLPRRLFCHALTGAGVVVWTAAAAQAPAKVYRLGQLTLGREGDEPEPATNPFTTELARLGLVESVNLVVDRRSARGNPALLDSLAAELVTARPDVLFSSSGFATARALQKATKTIPIVFAAVGEPVAAGLAASLSRPGGNLTGGAFPVELDLKRIEILLKVVGASASIMVLTTPVSERRMSFFLKDLAASGLRVQFQEVRKADDFAPAFKRMARQGAGGVAVATSVLTGSHEQEIAALALEHRMPAIGDGDTFAGFGLLMSYSVDGAEIARNAASYVYRILKGDQPADLPIQQATRFNFVVNRKTARVLGVQVPSSILVAATRVID